MPAPLEIRILNIDPVSWTPVSIPFDCTGISLKNSDAKNKVRIRTQRDNPVTEDEIGASGEQSLATPLHRYRFPAGSQPLWLRATAGIGPIVVTFLK